MRISWLVFVGVFGFTVLPWPALAAVADSRKAEWEARPWPRQRKKGEISFHGSQGYEKVFQTSFKEIPGDQSERRYEHARQRAWRARDDGAARWEISRRSFINGVVTPIQVYLKSQHSRTDPTGANPARSRRRIEVVGRQTSLCRSRGKVYFVFRGNVHGGENSYNTESRSIRRSSNRTGIFSIRNGKARSSLTMSVG